MLPNLTVVHSTKRGSHRVRPLAPSPPCSHKPRFTYMNLSFECLFSALSKQEHLFVIAHIQSYGISRHVHRALLHMTSDYNPVIKQCNSQVLYLYINHLSFSCKCHFVCENKADRSFCLRGENFDSSKCQFLSSDEKQLCL